METIDDLDALEALYGEPFPGAVTKVRTRLTPLYERWLGHARFCVLTTVGPEGTDASPRGDIDPVVRIVDATTLQLPDWRGNNRTDSLRNIVRGTQDLYRIHNTNSRWRGKIGIRYSF